MRTPVLLALTLLLSAPALAWVPKLEETTAKNVIDGAYGRRDPVPTFLTLDLNVKDGAFVSGPTAVTAFDGGATAIIDVGSMTLAVIGGALVLLGYVVDQAVRVQAEMDQMF